MFQARIQDLMLRQHGWRGWLAACGRLAERIQGNRACLGVLLLVLMMDSCLYGLDLAFRYAVLDGTELPNWFNLSQEMALGEIFEHLMVGTGVLSCLLLARRRRSVAMLLVGAVLLLVLCDNSLEWHENFGAWIAPVLPQGLPVQGHALGEMIFMASFGLLALAALWACLGGEPRVLLAGGALVVGCIGAASVFGIGVDMLHTMFAHGSFAEVIAGNIEDGGELLFMTLAGAGSLCLLLSDRSARSLRESNA